MPFATIDAVLFRMAAMLAVVIGLAVPAGAQTRSMDGALARLAADSFTETAAAIDEIALSGDAAAAVVLEALADRRLLFDAASKTVAIKDAGGKLIDARTMKALASPPAGLSPVRINNRLRNSLDASLGTLKLVSPDPAKRRIAAEAVFKSRKGTDRAGLEKAIEREKDASVATVMRKAHAAILLAQPDAPLGPRLDAVASLAAWTDSDTLGLLNQTLASAREPELKTAVEAAITRIEHQRQLLAGVQNVIYGLSLGS
ncbi:MAG: urea ABC transporter permease subunit UrtB, partial [Hyphomicrobiaceae bacterium]